MTKVKFGSEKRKEKKKEKERKKKNQSIKCEYVKDVWLGNRGNMFVFFLCTLLIYQHCTDS